MEEGIGVYPRLRMNAIVENPLAVNLTSGQQIIQLCEHA